MTELALVGLLPGMDPQMFRQSTRVGKSFLAHSTSEKKKKRTTSIIGSVTKLDDLLHFWQPFKSCGNNYFTKMPTF